MENKLKLEIIPETFSIVKVENERQMDRTMPFCFTAITDQEHSLVCRMQDVPEKTLECDPGWKAFRIQGILDFSLIGILSKITTILAEHEIGLFAISTYNTDYVFIKERNFKYALDVLEQAGYSILL